MSQQTNEYAIELTSNKQLEMLQKYLNTFNAVHEDKLEIDSLVKYRAKYFIVFSNFGVRDVATDYLKNNWGRKSTMYFPETKPNWWFSERCWNVWQIDDSKEIPTFQKMIEKTELTNQRAREAKAAGKKRTKSETDDTESDTEVEAL